MQSKILITKPSSGYALIDSGEGQKLERFGVFTLSRPDPQVLWRQGSGPEVWQKAQGVFSNETNGNGVAEKIGKIFKNSKTEKSAWKMKAGVPEKWQILLGGLTLVIKPSSFKHVGVFPEQVGNWDWIREQVKKAKEERAKSGEKISVLNLFGYTGGASLVAAQAGAEVCHVDSSKTALTWAKENAQASGLSDKPIRWILDDAAAFVRREIKRGKKYDAIIMDPPAFGRGPQGEVWKIENDFLPLLDLCKQILSDKPIFFLMSGYASGYSAIAYENILKNFTAGFLAGTGSGNTGTIEIGELAIEEEKTVRLLPAGIFGRWYAK